MVQLRASLKPIVEAERQRYFKGMDRQAYDQEYDR